MHYTGLQSRAEIQESLAESDAATNGQEAQSRNKNDERGALRGTNGVDSTRKTVEDIAGMVYKLVAAADEFATDMKEEKPSSADAVDLEQDRSSGEEVRLMRLRLRRREVVVVPGQSFMLWASAYADTLQTPNSFWWSFTIRSIHDETTLDAIPNLTMLMNY